VRKQFSCIHWESSLVGVMWRNSGKVIRGCPAASKACWEVFCMMPHVLCKVRHEGCGLERAGGCGCYRWVQIWLNVLLELTDGCGFVDG
jgi:hypothetical protein